MGKTAKHKGLKIAAAVFSALFTAILVLCLIYADNKHIDYEHFSIDGGLNAGADIKIAHLSDLHFPKIKADIDKMLQRLEDEKPDIIAVTGDLIDGGANADKCGVYNFIEKIKDTAPVFYVKGNHEGRNSEGFSKLKDKLIENGIIFLNNESVNIAVKGSQVTVIGLADNADYNQQYLNDNPQAETNYKILLAHRPEKWPNYISAPLSARPNLILSGHAHGGQFRFFGQGLFAPDQWFFPKYDAGLYTTGDGTANMVVSRGIGNSLFPFRFNNRPHIPVITVHL